ncbi:MAG: response regulator [Gammaproteobacteria bacterium]|nr:response regulator [Gammaproteobacteria bacterium]
MEKLVLLCVDDEKGVLNSLKRLLRTQDFKIITANSAKEGLELLKKHDVQVVMSDQRMPEMGGAEFLQEVKARHPDAIRVILSGYADVSAVVDAVNKAEIYKFLSKPWNDEELVETVNDCFTQYELRKNGDDSRRTT